MKKLILVLLLLLLLSTCSTPDQKPPNPPPIKDVCYAQELGEYVREGNGKLTMPMEIIKYDTLIRVGKIEDDVYIKQDSTGIFTLIILNNKIESICYGNDETIVSWR